MSIRDRLNRSFTRRFRPKTARSRLQAPVASFTFDDFPRSAWTVGGPILARCDARATYYTAGRFCGLREDGLDYYDQGDLRALHAAGHEIGCHTFSHRPSPTVGPAELEADLDRNAEFLRQVLGPVSPETFAYPYGEVSPRTKTLVGRRFAAGRGIHGEVNGATLDLGQLEAVPLELRNWTPERVTRAVSKAQATTGWLIFFSHDVSESPSPYGATPAMLDHALKAVTRAGLEVLPVSQALGRATSG